MNTFRQEESLQAILYILQKMGGKCDMHKCCKILYFADNAHLSQWGRSITGDMYIAMNYGAVPSRIYDLFKAVRGESYFTSYVRDIREHKFHFINKKDIVATCAPDTEWLSESDMEVLDEWIDKVRDMNFSSVATASHGYAWQNTAPNKVISLRDRLTELGDEDAFIDYVEEIQRLQGASLC